MKEKLNILFDLTFAGYPISGIPNEVALLFEMFATSEDIDVCGMIHQAKGRNSIRLNKVSELADLANIIAQFAETPKPGRGHFREKIELIASLVNSMIDSRFNLSINRAELKASDTAKELLFTSLFRIFFSGKVSPNNFDKLKDADYLFTKYNHDLELFKAFIKSGRVRFKAPNEFPIAINYGLKNILAIGHKGTIHRHVDLIALEDPDTLAGNVVIDQTKFYIDKILPKSDVIACLTETAREKLVLANPKLEKKSRVISVLIPQLKRRDGIEDEYIRKQFVSHNWFLNDLDIKNRIIAVKKLNESLSQQEELEYIICVSTVEPRKNYGALVAAWEYMRFNLKRNIKLVIVGGLGWKTDRIEHAIRTYALEGEIIPLAKVPKMGLEILLNRALYFVFLSHNEGFGVGPLEALQCGCPSLVLDKPIYREVYGNSVEYVNSAAADAVGNRLAQLIDERKSSDRELFREELDKKSSPVLSKYTPGSVREKWIETIKELAGYETYY